MPVFVQEQLKLTDAQKKELEALQKDVDAKIDKLLTDDQKKTLKELKERGPGRGLGGPGGPGGFPPPPPPQ
jgi:Spy/CpxP family protein refolding chaperone